MKIWMAEDTEDDGDQSGFGLTKEKAEQFVVENRAYDEGNGGYEQAIKDGWAKPAVEIDVPDALAFTLFRYQRNS